MTLNADGSFSYLPDDDYTGTDSFTYTASDGVATSAPATVTIVTSLPVANNDAITAISGQAATGNVLTNDTDAAGAYLNAGLATAPSHGSSRSTPKAPSFTSRIRASPGRIPSPTRPSMPWGRFRAGDGDHHRLLQPVG